MEIDDLKSIWKKADDKGQSGYWVSQESVKEIIKRKSNAAVADVIRQMRYKIRLSGIIGLLTLAIGVVHLFFIEFEREFFFSYSTTQYGIMMSFMSLCILTISLNSNFRYRQVSRLQVSSNSLKHNLTETKSIFKKLIFTNIVTDSVVLPIVITAGMAINFYNQEPFGFDIRLLYLVLTGPLAFFAFYKLSKFKMKRKLGRFIDGLDSRLKEIESIESEIIDPQV